MNQLHQMLGAQKTFRYAKLLSFPCSGADRKPWAKPSTSMDMLLVDKEQD